MHRSPRLLGVRSWNLNWLGIRFHIFSFCYWVGTLSSRSEWNSRDRAVTQHEVSGWLFATSGMSDCWNVDWESFLMILLLFSLLWAPWPLDRSGIRRIARSLSKQEVSRWFFATNGVSDCWNVDWESFLTILLLFSLLWTPWPLDPRIIRKIVVSPVKQLNSWLRSHIISEQHFHTT